MQEKTGDVLTIEELAAYLKIPKLYAELAAKVGFTQCTDDAFGKLKQVLRDWFGQEGDGFSA